MDFYMYKSVCPRWYGTLGDIRHIVVPKGTGESDVIDLARKGSNAMTGSGSCDIKLLQKYHMIIQPKKSYAALTALSFHGTVGDTKSEGPEEHPSISPSTCPSDRVIISPALRTEGVGPPHSSVCKPSNSEGRTEPADYN